jgi:predicted FMN-binding regulatory protein PaiB
VELIKDYDYVIDYHLGKTNVVADALSQKEKVVVCYVGVQHIKELTKL